MLAREYGYTPAQIGEMTSTQIRLLVSKDGKLSSEHTWRGGSGEGGGMRAEANRRRARWKEALGEE